MRSMTLWALALVGDFCATLLYGARGIIAPAPSTIGGFAFLAIGGSLKIAAIYEFRRWDIRWRLLAFVAIAAWGAHTAMFAAGLPEQALIAFTSFALGGWTIACAASLFVGAEAYERYAFRLTGTFFAVWGALSILRGLYAGFSGDTSMSLFADNAVEVGWLVVQFCAMMGTSLGFLLITKEHSDHEIIRLASLDSLTGLLNRRTFVEAAYGELSRASRHHYPTCILMLDLDHFKLVNDTYGHRAGDLVLKHFASVLKASIRPFDLAARYGGEEFCVLLTHVDAAGAAMIADRIRKAVCEANVELGEGRRTQYTVSIGVTNVPSKTIVLDDIVDRADEALYKAKASGRNCTVRLDSTNFAAPQAG
jgi:diguanylate cyclase (GGDEF)-like protein